MCELIVLENGSTAFICNCGKKKDHVCNSEASVLLLSNGDRVDDTEENRDKHWYEVTGGSVACSICGRAAIDDAPYM